MLGKILLLLAIVVVGHWKCEAAEQLSYPKEVEFLDVPQSFREFPFELKSGKIFWDSGLKSMPLSQGASNVARAFTGDGQYILGAPAIVIKTGYLDIKDIMQQDHGIARATGIENNIFVVIEKRTVAVDGTVSSRFEITRKRQAFEKIAVIIRKDNLYNEFLSDLYMVDAGTIAMVTSSSRHPYINTILLIDSNNGNILGIKGFGTMRYFPNIKAFRFTQQIPNCDNVSEVLKYNEERGQIIKIRENGKLSKVLLSNLRESPFELSR